MRHLTITAAKILRYFKTQALWLILIFLCIFCQNVTKQGEEERGLVSRDELEKQENCDRQHHDYELEIRRRSNYQLGITR